MHRDISRKNDANDESFDCSPSCLTSRSRVIIIHRTFTAFGYSTAESF